MLILDLKETIGKVQFNWGFLMNQANSLCELNSKALTDCGTSLADDTEWLHISTDYKQLQTLPITK